MRPKTKSVPPPRRPLEWVRRVLLRTEPRAATPASRKEADPTVEAAAAELSRQRAELGARLLLHDPKTQVVRHLFQVHDALRQHGWTAVEAMPYETVSRALVEAEILAEQEPSPLLDGIVARLAHIETSIKPQAKPLVSDWSRPMAPEVSETNFDEFEQMERSWVGTVPATL